MRESILLVFGAVIISATLAANDAPKLGGPSTTSQRTSATASRASTDKAERGVLEFRIAPTLPGTGELSLSDADHKSCLEQLRTKGPEGKDDDVYRWFLIQGKADRYHNLVTGSYQGEDYILLFNRPDPDRTLLHTGAGAAAWSLVKSIPTRDNNMKPAVGFEFDSRGANLFGILTGHNIGHYMAILLDDQVYSAPVIRSPIYDSGIITGDFTQQQVNDLVKRLNSGSSTSRKADSE
jgi:preprotein translocase subunit SecD